MHRLFTRSLSVFLSLLLLCLSCPAFAESAKADDSEALLDRYVESLFFPDVLTARGTPSAGSRLTGIRANTYKALLAEIKKIAAGETESTTPEIPLEQIMPKTSFTAKDLGVKKLLEYNAEAGEDQLTPEADAKLNEFFLTSEDLDAVMNSLLFDHPYELYWYEKDKGLLCMPKEVDFAPESDATRIVLTGSYEFRLNVSVAYRLDPSSEEEDAAYRFNSACVQKATQAANNAKKIVNEYAALGDLPKLRAYKDKICELVEYNHEAMSMNPIVYGDPWQLVWVFDEDPTTNVVCEGYSKAFKYLCDNSTFESDISVITPLGKLGNGMHMWNIVNMDGRNFLVDITNCDENTVGYPDTLFMARPTSGSVEEGYLFAYAEGTIPYSYTSETILIYTTEELSYEEPATFVLPGQIETIEMDAFCDIKTFNHVILPATCSSIHSNAFGNCFNLTAITIPNGSCAIADDAFTNTSLKTIYTVEGSSVAEWAESNGYDVAPLS